MRHSPAHSSTAPRLLHDHAVVEFHRRAEGLYRLHVWLNLDYFEAGQLTTQGNLDMLDEKKAEGLPHMRSEFKRVPMSSLGIYRN